jgi:hypothetical protein
VCVCVCIHIHIYAYICIYVCVYIYMCEWGLYINTVCARHRAMYNKGENKEYFSEATLLNRMQISFTKN